MNPLDAYSPDYATARSRFRSMLAERGWMHEAHEVTASSFLPGDLTIDVGRFGPADAERLLVLSSGLHGAEAPFGSAVQLAWLASLPPNWQPPNGFAVLLLHALNPFGFARIRRVNEDNVDLNRNFLSVEEFAKLRDATAATYGPLDPWLNPPRPPKRIEWFFPTFLWMAIRFGYSTLQHVMPAGQYAFPKGIFYGGDRHVRSTQIIMSEMPRWVGSARQLIHLDFHTGLGRFGKLALLASDPPDSDRVRFARRLFGDRIKVDHEIEDGYHNYGDMGEWLSRRFADRAYLYLCAEVGTYGTTRVIGTLRRENQDYHHRLEGVLPQRDVKAEMRQTFVPKSAGWRWSVVHQSLELIRTAFNHCAE